MMELRQLFEIAVYVFHETGNDFEFCECGRAWDDCATRDGSVTHYDRGEEENEA